eukprot:gene12181-8382_t
MTAPFPFVVQFIYFILHFLLFFSTTPSQFLGFIGRFCYFVVSSSLHIVSHSQARSKFFSSSFFLFINAQLRLLFEMCITVNINSSVVLFSFFFLHLLLSYRRMNDTREKQNAKKNTDNNNNNNNNMPQQKKKKKKNTTYAVATHFDLL